MTTTLSTHEAALPQVGRVVLIAANPNSGASNQAAIVDALVAELAQRGLVVRRSSSIEQIKAWVAELRSDRPLESSDREPRSLLAVVAAGGDGTVSLLANELPPQTPLAILPLGTENLLAKYLGLDASPQRLSDLIVGNRSVCLDVGRANGKLFLVMASCGFDAEVVSRLHANRKGHIRHWSYAKPIWGAVGQYQYPEVKIYVDDDPKPIVGKWAFVFNVPRYAMNLPIVAEADPTDGLLDLCAFRGGNLLRGLFYFAAVCLRQHRRWTRACFKRARRLRIEADGRVPFQLDGDPGGELPVEIELLPGFLRLLIPAE